MQGLVYRGVVRKLYMRFSSKSTTLLIAAILFNIAALSVYAFLWLGIKGANERASELGNDIVLAVREEQELKATKTLVFDTAPLREKLDGYFVPADGAVAFFESLESLGAEAGVSVSLESVSALPLPDSPFAETVRVVLRAEGPFAAALRFLALLETAPRAGQIEQFSFTASAPEGKKGTLWRIDATLRVLKLTAPAERTAS